jgi:DNA-binding protein
MDKILPLAAMEKLLKKGSAGIRVSDPAKEELRIVLEEYAVSLARTASEYSVHAKRKTIKAQDVRLAVKSRQ